MSQDSKPLPAPTTMLGLARAIGFSQPAISGWKKRFPDAPKGYDVAEWLAFIKQKNLGTVGNRVSKGREDLLKEKLTEEIRQLRLNNASKERKLIPSADVDGFLMHCASRLNVALDRLCTECAPKCAGLEVGDVRRILREHADTMRLTMQTAADDWHAEQEEARAAAALADDHHPSTEENKP